MVSGLPALETTAGASSPVGSYPITVGLGTLSAANYDFRNPINGTLSVVTSVTVSVNSSASTSTYGDSLVFQASVATLGSGGPTPTGTIEFQVDGVDLGSAVTLVSGMASSPSSTKIPAGTHTITALYSGDANYVPTSATTSQIINKASLTVTADDKLRVAGQPNPVLTVSYSGFVNGDGPASLASPAAVFTSATPSSPAGSYPINVSGATSPNYAITFRDGTLTVTSPPPLPLVTITRVRTVTNKKHLVTQVLVTFSGPVNATEAQNVATYRLATAGKKGSFDAKNAKLIKLKSAVYNAASNTVTLTPKKAFALTKPVQLRVNGQSPSGLQDSSGRLIDGDHDGTAGGNAVALLRRGGVTVSSVVSVRFGQFPVMDPHVVDDLLERTDAFE